MKHTFREEEGTNKQSVAHRSYEEWKEMREEDFLFSVYPNDLLRVTSKKIFSFTKQRKDSDLPDTVEGYSFMAYYRGTDISSSAITCLSHDGAYIRRGLGIKTLECIEKYEVDVLGEYHKVNKEVRQPFSVKKA